MQAWRVRCKRLKRTNSRSGRFASARARAGGGEGCDCGVRSSRSAGMFFILVSVVRIEPQSGRYLHVLPGFLGAQFATHLERLGQPEQGVKAADHEGSEQKRSHAPEGPEEEGIFLRVVVRGMGEIAGKPAGCRGMTFLASRDHVGPAEVRPGIADTQNVVGAVAVITFRRLGVAQAR